MRRLIREWRDKYRYWWYGDRWWLVLLSGCALIVLIILCIRFPGMLPLHNKPDAFRIHMAGETVSYSSNSPEYREIYKRIRTVGGYKLTDILFGKDIVMYSVDYSVRDCLPDYLKQGLVLEAVYSEDQTAPVELDFSASEETYRNVFYVLEYTLTSTTADPKRKSDLDGKECVVFYERTDRDWVGFIANIPYPRKAAEYIKEHILPADEP